MPFLILPGMATQTIKIYRQVAGSRVKGRWVDGSETTFDIIGSLQPVSGQDLQYLPEGERTKDTIKIYADTQLFTLKESAATKADQISVDGRRYEVKVSKPYKVGNSFGYNKILAVDIVDGS